MVYSKELRKEKILFTSIIDFYFERGWLTENEKLQFKLAKDLKQKKLALFDLMRNMKCDVNSARLNCAIRCINEVGSDETKNNFVYVILTNLFEKHLITEKEKFEYEQLLADNGPRSVEALKMIPLKELRTDEYTIRNPMQHSPVIRCILQYLNVIEIKKSRYISKEWASVALKVLTIRSRVKLDTDRSKTPLKFFQVFPDILTDIIPFSAFSFFGYRERPCPIDELNYFFERQGKYILEIELRCLNIVDNNWKEVKRFDISPWLSKTLIALPTTKRMTKIKIPEMVKTKLTVDLSSLAYVNHLCLNHCGINVQDGVRMSPITIDLSNVTIVKDGRKLEDICINDILDFSKAKRVLLKKTFYEDGLTRLSLDLHTIENVTLERLRLESTSVRNWGACNWTVNALKLERVLFTKATQMKIVNLHTTVCEIDLSVLPQSLEKLFIEEISRSNNILCSQPVILQNLKTLHLNFLDDSFLTFFYHDLSFPNLTNLSLKTFEPTSIDVDWIPETVKVLRLRRVEVKNERNKNVIIDKLILKCFDVTDIPRTPIQTKELVLEFHGQKKEAISSFLEFLEYHKNSCQRIYAGTFYWKWPEKRSLDCHLRNFVRSESDYYVFVNQMGKSIDYHTFSNILNSDFIFEDD